MVARSRLSALLLLLLACGDDASPTGDAAAEQPAPEPRADAALSPMDAATSLARDAAGSSAAPLPADAAPLLPADASADAGMRDAATTSACAVGPVPSRVREQLGLDAFYRKYADANGLAVLGSDAPDDAALTRACQLVQSMVAAREDVRLALIAAKARFAIIGKDEGTADIPEYGYRQRSQAERDQINQRARGLGGQVASCGEENIACLAGDRYRDESICVHEFAHTISTYGVYRADRGFEARLTESFEDALASGILERTYRKESVQEYWAEGVQDYFDTNASARPPNGIHNEVDTRAELASFDPTLHALVAETFPMQLAWEDCHAD